MNIEERWRGVEMEKGEMGRLECNLEHANLSGPIP